MKLLPFYFVLFLFLTPFLSAQTKEEIQAMRDLWAQRSQGENLAIGKRVKLVPKTDYKLTVKGDSDELDLTDGEITNAPKDHCWFSEKAIGWYFADGLERLIMIDLENPRPIDRIVIRLLGGTAHTFQYPQAFQVWISDDGKLFRQALEMTKLQPNEADQCDWKTTYYLPENGATYETFMYPFELPVQATGRYVILKIIGSTGSVFSDEMAILKARDLKKVKRHDEELQKQTAIQFPLEGVVATARWPELGLVRGLTLPQHFRLNDLREPGFDAKVPVEMGLELPAEIEFVNAAEVAKPGDVPNHWVVKANKSGAKYVIPALYFRTVKKNLKKGAAAKIYALVGGVKQFETELPVRVEELKEFKPFEKSEVSLAWMVDYKQDEWPAFFENYRKLGFNAVPTFPRYWAGNEERTAKRLPFLDAARKQGFKIVMNDSPLHMMLSGKPEGHEIFCQVPGKKLQDLCPCYRGEHFDAEMRRVANAVRLSRPDEVFFDIECWEHAMYNAQTCTRCQEKFHEAQKSEPNLALEEFILRQGKEIMHALHEAVVQGAKEAGISTPKIGSYGRHPKSAIRAIERFTDIYPAETDFCMPSLYCMGRGQVVHETISEDHKLLGNREIVPWLSAGCYGEFPPEKMEALVLESFLNGSRGITYYCFEDFDTPLDFYFHAKALAELRPYEKLLIEGEKIETVKCLQKSFLISAWGTKKEMILLIGNYFGAKPEAILHLPFKNDCKVRDLQSGEKLKLDANKPLKCEVPKGGIRLFYVTEP